MFCHKNRELSYKLFKNKFLYHLIFYDEVLVFETSALYHHFATFINKRGRRSATLVTRFVAKLNNHVRKIAQSVLVVFVPCVGSVYCEWRI